MNTKKKRSNKYNKRKQYFKQQKQTYFNIAFRHLVTVFIAISAHPRGRKS